MTGSPKFDAIVAQMVMVQANASVDAAASLPLMALSGGPVGSVPRRVAFRAAGVVARVAKLCGCYEAGTEVWTEHGLRPIEEIAIGDLVWARDEATGEDALKPVTALIRPEGRALYELTLLDADGETEVHRVTDDHPYWIRGVDGFEGGWVDSVDLTPGQIVETHDARGMTVVSLDATGEIEPVTYNLTVADFHTYFVGEDLAWVHNCGDIANKANHIFGGKLQQHKLEDFLSAHGGDTLSATRALQQAGDNLVATGNYTARQLQAGVATNINGHTMTIRGTIVDSKFKLGTAFVP